VTDASLRRKFEGAWGVAGLPDQIGLTSTTAIDAMADGKLRGLYVLGENIMMSHPDQNHVRKMLQNLEFLVVQEIFPTLTTQLAHVVLPATSFAEKDGTFTSTERRVQRVRKAIEPVGQSKPDWEILCEIARRAGYGGMAYPSPKEVMDEIAILTPIYGGISYERIDRVGLQWPCPDPGHPGTPILHQSRFTRGLGLFSPAEYQPPAELPDSEYPLLLSTGRCYFHYHGASMTKRSRLLQREVPFPYIEISPEDAKELGVADREWVYVSTRRGEVRAQARTTDVVMKGVLFMPFHFEEGPANALTLNALDPGAKIPEYKVCAARIRKAR